MVDNTAEAGLQQDIDDFNDYLNKLDPNRLSASPLGHVYIPDAVRPLKTKGADVGVSGDLINEGSAGLPVVIQSYSKMQVDDVIKIYWDDDLVWTHKVRAGQDGQPLTFNIPTEDIPAGITELYCSVTPVDSESEEQSPHLSVLVRLNYPGENAANEDSLAPPLVSHDKIELDSQGVQVTIPVYSKMRRYDRIYLSWSDHTLEHEVKSNEVGKAVVM